VGNILLAQPAQQGDFIIIHFSINFKMLRSAVKNISKTLMILDLAGKLKRKPSAYTHFPTCLRLKNIQVNEEFRNDMDYPTKRLTEKNDSFAPMNDSGFEG
jgi:hypothetical protein